MKSYWIRGGVSALSIVAGIFLVLGGCSSGGSGDTPPAAPPPPVSVTLTIAKTGTGTGTITSNPAGLNCGATCTLTVTSGTVVTLIAAPTQNNTLADWGGACATASATCLMTVTTNQTVTMTFNTSTATPALTIANAGTGVGNVTCNGAACDPTYPWGSGVTLSGVPQAGSSFAGWSGGICTGTADCTVVLWGDTVVTATFNTLPVTAQLTVTKNGTGSGTVDSSPVGINCGATCSANFSGGTIVMLTASASAGSTFAGWTGGGCSGTGTCEVTLNANTAVTATFNTVPPTSSLTVTTAGTGTGAVTCNGATCNPSYPSGTALTIVATPAVTSLFSGWGGACASAGTVNTCNLTINANSTLSATFNLPTLSVVVAGTGTVTTNPAGINCGTTCTASFNNGTSITLTATGAGFSGGGCTGTSTCILVLTQNTTVTANFGGAGLPSFAQAALEAYVKASNTEASDNFGATIGSEADVMHSVALDGDTLVVGAAGEDSNATGTTGTQVEQDNNSATNSGAVYVFTRDNNGIWSQQAYLKASNTKSLNLGQRFGSSIALSGDTLAVGAYNEWSNAKGVNGDDTNTSAAFSGAVYVFTRTGNDWRQQAYVKASNTEAGDHFGTSVALSGNTLAVGAKQEDSNATGTTGTQVEQDNNSASNSGAVYVFTRTGGVWRQQAYVKASNTGAGDKFGFSVALAGDTLAVGAYLEDSNAKGVEPGSIIGDQTNNSAGDSGAVYVFTRDNNGIWSQQAYVKASNTGSQTSFGYSVALSGETLAVGSSYEDSPESSGAVYVFTRTGGVWREQAYVKALNTGAFDLFGASVALSGNTLAVGAIQESSNATLVNGDQTNNSASNSGAVYVFTRTGNDWSQQAYVKASNTGTGDRFGGSVALAGDTLAVGAERESSDAKGVDPGSIIGNQTNNSAPWSGAVYVYRAQ